MPHVAQPAKAPVCKVVDLGLQVYAMLRDITAVDGGTDLAKYSIIPCFFL